MDEKWFPTDETDYYNYCRISCIKEVREKYKSCYGYLLSPLTKTSNSEDSEVNYRASLCLDDTADKTAIFKSFKKLYDDFLTYCNRITSHVNTEEEYTQNLKMLILLSNKTYDLASANFSDKKNIKKNMKEMTPPADKKAIKEETEKISEYIYKCRDISYYLNPEGVEQTAALYSDTIISPLVLVMLIALTITFLFSTGLIHYLCLPNVNTDDLPIAVHHTLSFVTLIIGVATALLTKEYCSSGKKIKERYQIAVQFSRNKPFEFRPLSKKWSFKNILELLQSIKELLK